MSRITVSQETAHRLAPVAVALIVSLLWINASEVFRYFAMVTHVMHETFQMLPDVPPITLSVLLSWGLWDTFLMLAATLVPWTAMKVFGARPIRAVLYGTGDWIAVFVILWLGLYNMSLAPPRVLAVALPLAWVEMVVAALSVWWFTARGQAFA